MVDEEQTDDDRGADVLDRLATESSTAWQYRNEVERRRNRDVLEQLVEADASILDRLRDVTVEASDHLDELHIPPPDDRWDQFLDTRLTSRGLQIRGRPFDFEWSKALDWGTPTADRTEGTFELSVSSGGAPGDTEHTWNGAGIGIRFTPRAGMIRVAPYMPYHYRWHNDSTLEVARNRGELGVLVREVGGRTLEDPRHPLWNDGTSWYQEHSDERNDVFSDSTFALTSDRELEIWFWCNSSIDYNRTNGAFDFGSSRASNSLAARVGWVVIEQFT